MEKGKFIALEGIDGSGKSSQIGPLVKRLEGLGVPCRETREPTGGPVGSLIRQIFTGRVTADNRVIAALYAADRIDHLVNEVDGLCSAIDSGITVVSDRYYFSSYAYHSVDVDMGWVIQANALSAQLLRPRRTGCAKPGSFISGRLSGWRAWSAWPWWTAPVRRTKYRRVFGRRWSPASADLGRTLADMHKFP